MTTASFDTIRLVPSVKTAAEQSGTHLLATPGRETTLCGAEVTPAGNARRALPQLAARTAAADTVRDDVEEAPATAAAAWLVRQRDVCPVCQQIAIDDILAHDCSPVGGSDLEWIDEMLYDSGHCKDCGRGLTVVYSRVGVRDSATGEYIEQVE